ncbi:MAG: serine hydrolase, partial [Xanthomonadales bacterium]|nr:serine hydrolase [Xanthomonadales bacterium]
VVDGVHYRSDCAARNGKYPLCDELLLPSYSTAKALFAGRVFDHFAKRDPGFPDTAVLKLVPECELPDGRWQGVTLRHLANMSTGLYDSEAFEADEGAQRMVDGFFIPTTNAARIEFACTAYPRMVPPGSVQVYHTSDTWLLGVAMNRYLQTRRGKEADIHRDVLLREIYAPLSLSDATTHSLRSTDDDAQPYAGFGLTFTPDDAARLGLFLADKTPDFEQVPDWPAARGERYRNGVWAVDAAAVVGCPEPVWIPFLSGFGGITIAMLPHGALFYVFGDGNTFRWLRTAAQLHAFQPWCEEPPQ